MATSAVGAGEAMVGKFGSKPRNPNGSKGDLDHQAGVDRAVKDLDAQKGPGETVRRERKVQGHDLNRKPDAQLIGANGKTRKVIEVERSPNSKYHKKRLEDYKRCGIECETRPIPRKAK
jgi:hypothetical protein